VQAPLGGVIKKTTWLPLRAESKKPALAVTPTHKLFILADSPADTRQNMKLTFKCGINKFFLRRSGWGPL
jgi:hypothetical protein